MAKPRRRGRIKKKRAREAAEAELAAASSSASRPALYPDARVTAVDQEGDAFSTAGTALANIRPRVHGALAFRPAYLDDDDRTVASDTTLKTLRLADKPQFDEEDDEDSSSDGSDNEGGYDDGIDERTLILNGKFVDNPDMFLTFEGVTNVRRFDGAILRYLFNERFALSETDNDYGTWVKKNLIVAFQGHVLYEDCLSAVIRNLDGKRGHLEGLILSKLQGDVGLSVGYETHFLQVRAILEAYKHARIDVIAKAVQANQVPKDPSDRLTALLLELIDYYIMYKTSKIPLKNGPLLPVDRERLEEKSQTMRGKLADPAEVNTLFTEVFALIPSEERGMVPTRPWFCETWVKRNVAFVVEPTTSGEMSPRAWKPESPTSDSQEGIEAADTSRDSIAQPWNALSKKRKRNGDMVSQGDHWMRKQ